MDQLINQILVKLPELGVTGLLFIMWWFERKDRVTAEKREDSYVGILKRNEEREEEVIRVIKENTQAITNLSALIARTSSTH